jgi:hypothetical protein
MNDKVPIVRLYTGVPGLNEALGGGIPEFSFNLIAGWAWVGKDDLNALNLFRLRHAGTFGPLYHGPRRTTSKIAAVSAAICIFQPGKNQYRPSLHVNRPGRTRRRAGQGVGADCGHRGGDPPGPPEPLP